MDKVVGDVGRDPVANDTMTILPNAEDLLYSVQTFCGGVALDNGTPELNTANRMKNLLEETSAKADFCGGLTDGKVATKEAPHTTGAGTPQDERRMSARFRGLVGGESSCRYLNTSITGSLQVQIQTAGAEVCMVSAPSAQYSAPATYAAVAPTKSYPSDLIATGTTSQRGYTIKDYHFVVDCLSLSNGFYEAMLRARIQESGFISINYKAYNVFLNSLGQQSQGAAKFSLSASSIDKLYGTLRVSDYNTGLVPANGFGAVHLSTNQFLTNAPPFDHVPAGDYCCIAPSPPTVATGVNTNRTTRFDNKNLPQSLTLIPNFFKFSNYGDCLPNNPAQGITGAINVDNPFKSYWVVNSVHHPQQPQNELGNAVKANLYSEQEHKKTSGNCVGSLRAYRYVGFVDQQRLNFPTNLDTDQACVLKSGYSSRGVSAQLVWNCSGINTGHSRQMVVVCESTSTLRCGAGRQLSVVF